MSQNRQIVASAVASVLALGLVSVSAHAADDTKGKETLTVHGQKDMHTAVENDQTTTVHNKRTETEICSRSLHRKLGVAPPPACGRGLG